MKFIDNFPDKKKNKVKIISTNSDKLDEETKLVVPQNILDWQKKHSLCKTGPSYRHIGAYLGLQWADCSNYHEEHCLCGSSIILSKPNSKAIIVEA